jgi:hypothetical protein
VDAPGTGDFKKLHFFSWLKKIGRFRRPGAVPYTIIINNGLYVKDKMSPTGWVQGILLKCKGLLKNKYGTRRVFLLPGLPCLLYILMFVRLKNDTTCVEENNTNLIVGFQPEDT